MIDTLRKMSEEELVEMEEKAGENLQSSLFAQLIDGQPRRNTC